jgi:hypothetical protein
MQLIHHCYLLKLSGAFVEMQMKNVFSSSFHIFFFFTEDSSVRCNYSLNSLLNSITLKSADSLFSISYHLLFKVTSRNESDIISKFYSSSFVNNFSDFTCVDSSNSKWTFVLIPRIRVVCLWPKDNLPSTSNSNTTIKFLSNIYKFRWVFDFLSPR